MATNLKLYKTFFKKYRMKATQQKILCVFLNLLNKLINTLIPASLSKIFQDMNIDRIVTS